MVQVVDHKPLPTGFTVLLSCCTLEYAITIADKINEEIKAMAVANARYAQDSL
jgi:hypothetical protein